MTANFDLRYSHTVGLAAMEGRGFSNPCDVAISSEGRIYVVSRANAQQPYGVRVGICNLESEYFGDFGSYGSGDGQFVWPSALAFDSEGLLYIADEYNHRITVFEKSGAFLSKWGVHGTGDGQLNGPSGISFDSQGDVYIVDSRNSRVQKFTKDGCFLFKMGDDGTGSGQFKLPWGITLDTQGDVYVADWGNDRIQKFDPDGNFLVSFGESGDGGAQFHRPSSVAVDSDGYLYIADWGNERVQVLEPDGLCRCILRGQATLSKWAEEFYWSNPDEKEARDRSALIPSITPEVTTPYEESARIEEYFWGPVSVKVDAEDRLYVTETNRHRIQIYQRSS